MAMMALHDVYDALHEELGPQFIGLRDLRKVITEFEQITLHGVQEALNGTHMLILYPHHHASD